MSKTILCADDSVTMQKVAEITFAASDYRCVAARSADEALKLAQAETPALILADAVMPGKTGYDLCKMIKGDAALASVPVVLMCGNSQAYDAARGEEVGADGHVAKPWDSQVLLDKVAEVIAAAAGGAVAKPAAGASAPAAAAAPAKPAAPPSVPVPAASAPQPPRSATIMGMPAVAMPPGGFAKAADKPFAPPTAAAPPPKPEPVAAPAAKPAAVAPPPRPEPVPAPVVAAPAAAPAAARPTPGDGAPMARAPMIKSVPTSRPDTNARIIEVLGRMPRVMDAAKASGIDPQGPEMQALLKLSFDVVERIVWEIVPELAEELVRENLDKLAARAR
jgi:CheY-like chemotaxis protein